MALQKIKLSNGKIREVQDHLAFDTALQKQQGFTPCDDNGIPLSPGTKEKKSKALSPPAAADNTSTLPVTGQPGALDEQIVEAHKKGASYVEIAKQHGLHWKKVEAILKKHTVNTPA